ncbi:MAG: glycosyltransferase, partial [Planctomycetes bacterium]|nr:glycosyltransferase [Planctomycetota bacterium]
WHAHRALGVATLLVTGAVGPEESQLSPADGGVPQISLADVERLGPDANGWLVLPSLRRGVDPLGDLRAAAQLRRVLRLVRPDVVHTHTSKAGWIGRRAARAVGVPCVAHTFHGLVLRDYFGALGSWWLRRLERRLARRTDLLFAVSASCREELVELGVAAAERIAVLSPAVPLPAALPRGEARRQLDIDGQDRRAVFVGRDAPVKRLEHFVAAIAAAPAWSGDVVGLGAWPAALEAHVHRAAGRLRLCGPDPQIAQKLAAYDALVLPSRREGLPLVAIEAFAAGVPVVGYDVPGVGDALAEGRGILVPESAGPAGLAAALARLADGALPDVAAARAMAEVCAPRAVAARLLAAYAAAKP